ncbi:MAG: metallophosphoesterase [Deltaproteobacteria bacterium]|nr:metallophosphoesterase [Deltaproteobacteria bacterium]MBZ0219712.1 metallophosphoesterase [Deltaproteobacteria bacterium]
MAKQGSGTSELPIIISPNLGCPVIVSVKDLASGSDLTLIVASRSDGANLAYERLFKDRLFLRISYAETGSEAEIKLTLRGCEEIKEWNRLHDFSDLDETRTIINSELHYKVLGEGTRYWKIKAFPEFQYGEDNKRLLRNRDGRLLPCLYDIVFLNYESGEERVNFHSVQVIEGNPACSFIHATDLHVAKRNDEILDEVLKTKCNRKRDDIRRDYVNFNDNVRSFIRQANRLADSGELDFVVMTGDLVDFSFLGWEGSVNFDENNWRTFENIITGGGREKERTPPNEGLKVALFTSTGNHDWRLYPYDPCIHNTYGIKKDELKNYKYKCYDSEDYPEDERARRSKELAEKLWYSARKISLHRISSFRLSALIAIGTISTVFSSFIDSLPAFIVNDIIVNSILKWNNKVVTTVFAGFLNFAAGATGWLFIIVPLLVWLGAWVSKRWLKRGTDMLAANPLHAGPEALHYYLKRINPYFDYAFSYAGHSFIIMDSGSDAFTARLLDGKESKSLKKLSLKDNIFGGSPDSKGFDSEQKHYNWSQIVWLEKVLYCLKQGRSRTFAFFHSPPINPDEKSFDPMSMRESARSARKWISKRECVMTYGTVNHYLSQFFNLCLGYREAEIPGPKLGLVRKYLNRIFPCSEAHCDTHGLGFFRRKIASLCDSCTKHGGSKNFVGKGVKPIDMVFSGHAHQNIEFRIAKDINHEIRIYHDDYSLEHDPNRPFGWEGNSCIIVQTAACGVPGQKDAAPPYYRHLQVDHAGRIAGFRASNEIAIIF